MPHVLVSAAHKSSGKTTISIGLCAALRARGIDVQPFKKGPDYIDPMWLASASGHDCHNLDFYTMHREEIQDNFARFAHSADFSLIEGNKGLYDGLDLDGSNSNAALAKLLDAPVVLVLDARGMTRGVAPLILGYQAFDEDIRIGGVILNRLGGSRHEAKLRRVIEHYTDVPVIGAVHQHEDMAIVERHLGLMPSNEAKAAQQHIDNIARHVNESVDLDKLLEIGNQASEVTKPASVTTQAETDVRIAVARDAASVFTMPVTCRPCAMQVLRLLNSALLMTRFCQKILMVCLLVVVSRKAAWTNLLQIKVCVRVFTLRLKMVCQLTPNVVA